MGGPKHNISDEETRFEVKEATKGSFRDFIKKSYERSYSKLQYRNLHFKFVVGTLSFKRRYYLP